MDDDREPSEEIRFRDIAPAIEFVCWVVVVLAPLLRLVNGPAVTDDQFVIQMILFATALAGGIGLQLYRIFNRRSLNSGGARRSIHKELRASFQDNFRAVYVWLEKPRIARRAVAVLLVIHTFLLGYSAYVHSPTLNEPGHLVAGLSHWEFGRFDVYKVNPPLVKMVAALPVMAAGYKEDWSGFYEGPGARPEMSMGENFVAANGERSFFLFMIARWACIPFSWLGAIVCYLWARDLYGRPCGVFASMIWCFEPNILAHASLITADAAGTALGLAACYTFWRWLKRPTWTQAALTGVVLGLAELAKTTLILFYPLWPLMWVVYRWPEWRQKKVSGTVCQNGPQGAAHKRFLTPFSEAGMLALRMLVGLYVLNLGYGFEGSFTQLKDFHFVSNLFSGEERGARGEERESDGPGTNNPQSEIRNPQSINRFAGSWLGHLPVPFPKNYLLGIDLQQKDFEHYGRPSYLRGEWRDRGWWYYYLYAAAIKVPLALWLLGFFVIITRLARFAKSACYKLQFSTADSTSTTPMIPSHLRGGLGRGQGLLRDEFILLFPAFVILLVVSSQTGINEHFRYALPCAGPVFIWLSQAARVFRNALPAGDNE